MTRLACKTSTKRYAGILHGSPSSTEKETLDLSPHQVKQAETERASADSAVTARLPEAYQWLIVPGQNTPQAEIEWQAFRLSGRDAIAVRASKKLRNDELLVNALAGTRLRMELDRVPLWRGEHVAIKQLTEDFARYLYLPRLTEPQILFEAASEGLTLLTWQDETFAYADAYDEATGRYRGLRCGQRVNITDGNSGLLVKSETAKRQATPEPTPAKPGEPQPTDPITPTHGPGSTSTPSTPSTPALPKRFHGSITVDATRVGRDAGRIADEVVAHLAGLVGSKVSVTLEIQAEVADGVPEKVVRIVTENCRTLKFSNHGFEDS